MGFPLEKSREITLQILWAISAHAPSPQNLEQNLEKTQDLQWRERLVALLAEDLKVSKKAVYNCFDRARAIEFNILSIDPLIALNSVVAIDYLGTVELALLRLAVFEMVIEKVTPPKVVIGEAVRMANKFAQEEAGKLLNGILDAIYKKLMHNDLDKGIGEAVNGECSVTLSEGKGT